MADLSTRLRLSPLPALASFLVQRAQANDELQAALDDGLADYTEGAEVVVQALRALLDEFLQEGQAVLLRTDQAANPFVYLAIGDHLEIVEQFRELLG